MPTAARFTAHSTAGAIVAGLLLSLSASAFGQVAPPATPGSPETPPAATRPDAPPPALLPDGRGLWNRALTSMGGTEAIEAIKSLHATITLRMGSRDMEIETWVKGDDLLMIRNPIPQMGADIMMGRNGEISWIEAPIAGVQPVEPAQLEQFGQLGTAHMLLMRIGRTYRDISTSEETIFAGRPCYVLKFAQPIDASPDAAVPELFVIVDARTGLPAGLRRPAGARPGERGAEFTFDLWDQEGDLVLFREMEVRTPRSGRAPASMQQVTFETIRFNTVEDHIFEIPPALREAATPVGPPAGPPPSGEGEGPDKSDSKDSAAAANLAGSDRIHGFGDSGK